MTRLNCLESWCFGSGTREPGTSTGMLSIVFKNASNVCTLNTYFKFMHFVVIHFVPNKSGATINIQTSPTAVIPMTSSASSSKLQSRSLINIHRSNQARWGATLFVYPCYLRPDQGGCQGAGGGPWSLLIS